MTKTTGRAAFLQLLVDEGVTHLFGNPGTTELAIMEVVPQFPQLEFVLGLQEAVVMAMADGFCRASGRLAAANVHVMPGLGNAMGALYNAKFSGSPVILTVAPHVVAAAENLEVQELASGPDMTVRVQERVGTDGGGVSLADASVVVSGGRGVGSTEGFAVIEELAELLGGAVGCSRAVTMAGWRPHTDQVGQTGTKIAPEIYIACGISGATQHMAGAKGAKKLLAINPDAEASIFASADYGVIGDLHEVVPAISAEIRKARGA